MGIDAEIYFKVKEGENYDGVSSSHFSILQTESEFKPLGATHVVSSMCRVYDFGYERGNWPLLALMLMQLLASPQIETVWYGGENVDSEYLEILTNERFLNIMKHYLEHGNRPYLDRFREIATPAEGKE